MDVLIKICVELLVILLLMALLFFFRKRSWFQKFKDVIYGVFIFLVFAWYFASYRHTLYSVNSWLFALTGEIQQVRFSEGGKDDDYPAPAATGAKPAADAKNKKATDSKTAAPAAKKTESDPSKPVRSNLPQTPQPKILLVASSSMQDIDEKKMPLFPPLRSFNGTEWKKEKTEIRMASDGLSLYASFLCYDADPANLTTKYSESEGTISAWKDDSIEFFLMKDKNADCYYQIATSASGLSHIFYMKTQEGSITSGVNQGDFPAEFKKPFIRSEKCPEGYKVTMEVNLQSMGFPKLDAGKEILVQVVRNYRDLADPSCAELQLFPTFIYGDNRYGSQNHDRRAFMPARIVK
ncbi:MAG TPA: hypothetical protein DCZ94_04370 [Lentisphaeria bacterium]|nr:MAG: hypothetical protein A2X48_20400 [Lentisphaerae bacterium GWF2_49_21]HBC86171.1 hypothetical protein [Lentisphaeria bacterium]